VFTLEKNKMDWQHTIFEGVFLFEPMLWQDERGYFFETFNQSSLPEALKNVQFVQDNESKSTFGVVRGLHYQLPPFAQAKLVRCVVGRVLDVIVDIRPDSSTYGLHGSFILDSIDKKQLYVPHGFAHGYAVLSDTAIFAYKCDQYYHKAAEGGINCLDPNIAIDWGLASDQMIISEKDKACPYFENHTPFVI
jgi:dTDP-4-dehydrorhamnose 3,5-epimerase